jgi:hypothetical protein
MNDKIGVIRVIKIGKVGCEAGFTDGPDFVCSAFP